jgi:PIN domain nuclease of toxin-antitoxin system
VILLDTHVLIWMDADDSSLGAVSRKIIDAAWREGQVAVCAITFWEVAQLVERGRISLPVTPNEWRADWLQAGLVEIPLDGRVALSSVALSLPHRDPADRFIVAAAIQCQATLLTADQKILGWEHSLLRQNAGQ